MWFIIAIIAFFLLAAAAVVDKYLLSQKKIVPLNFAFYITFLGGVASVLLIPLANNFYFPQEYFIFFLLGGGSLFFGLYFMFVALSRSEVTKANALIVGFIPLAVFLLSWLLGLEMISYRKVSGVILLVGGGYLLSQAGAAKSRLDKVTWSWVILASLLLGVSNAYSKIVYEQLSFFNAFIWLRWVTLAVALLFIMATNQWSKILIFNSRPKQPWLPFIGGQISGSLGVILLQYAIKLGNVILVTALNGLQFFFVIFIVYLLSKFFPKILKEDIRAKFIKQKIFLSLILFVGIILILL